MRGDFRSPIPPSRKKSSLKKLVVLMLLVFVGTLVVCREFGLLRSHPAREKPKVLQSQGQVLFPPRASPAVAVPELPPKHPARKNLRPIPIPTLGAVADQEPQPTFHEQSVPESLFPSEMSKLGSILIAEPEPNVEVQTATEDLPLSENPESKQVEVQKPQPRHLERFATEGSFGGDASSRRANYARGGTGDSNLGEAPTMSNGQPGSPPSN